MKRLLTIVAAATIATAGGLAVETFDASPARADTCMWGPFGGGYCDSQYWPDGSYYHCLNTRWGGSCGRVCPPPPGGVIPAPYPGPGPGGAC